jgi:hypothetical protein
MLIYWNDTSNMEELLICFLLLSFQALVSSSSSQLIVFAIPKSGKEPPSKMASANLSGILVPDVLHFDVCL